MSNGSLNFICQIDFSKEIDNNKALDEEVHRLKDVIKDLKKSLNEHYDKLQSNELMAKNNDRKHEHMLNEARKRNQSMEEKMQQFEKQIVSSKSFRL